MRTYVAECTNNTFYPARYEQAGILRYDNTSKVFPSSNAWNDVSKACSDETYSSLRPILEWQVGNPANAGQEEDVILNLKNPSYPLAAFALQPGTFGSTFVPLRIDYGDPTFLHLNNTKPWPSQWVVIPENYTDKDWVRVS